MLNAAGVEYRAVPSSVDESAIKAELNTAEEIAGRLAEAKALDVSAGHPDDLIIGSDSVVSVDGRVFDKPADRRQAEGHLRFFSGKTMLLTSAVAFVRSNVAEWTHVESARLTVRPLSNAFIQSYLDAEWPEVGYCVGVFRMEGRGVQLFDRIDGDYFTILGMPLIPLLRALREQGLLPE
jgi:septum formation protein